MSILNNSLLLGADAGAAGYQISRSLRFNSADSAYLSRTPAAAGNRKTWTWAGWVKRCEFGAALEQVLHSAFVAGGGTQSSIGFLNDALNILFYNGTVYRSSSTALFRDPSAWYHIVFAIDTTQASTSDRCKVYVNGAQITMSAWTVPQNTDTLINAASQSHDIGTLAAGAFYKFNGYLADIHFIDGQALTPSSFAETNATTGQWVPKAYSGSYGTNGFQLKFADNSAATATTLGKDTSGNSNNWTPNNLSVTAGAGNDSLVDTPTSYGTDDGLGGSVRGNYATLNILDKHSEITLANGNLDASIVANTSWRSCRSTIGISSGKWYWESTGLSGGSYQVGISKANATLAFYIGYDADGWGWTMFGQKWNNNTPTAYGSTWTTGDIIGIAFDADAGTLTFYKNGVSQGVAFTGLTSGPYFPAVGMFISSQTVNFGQRQWAYTPPAGFKALCDTNLPAPVVAKPSTVFDTKLYTGNGSTQTISGLGFNPDLVWIKGRSGATDHALYDAVRGVQLDLVSNSTATETTQTQGLTAFNSDGFSLGTLAKVNTSSATYVSWCWDAGSSTVTNTQGSITSQVRANASAGFSIVTYTGTGANATVGHGLGVAPSMVIVKRRNTTDNWQVRHTSIAAANSIQLNLTNAAASATTVWNSTTPSSTVFSVGTDATVNASGGTYVAYCFAPVAGYSAFGSYTGNGNGGADGPFVYLGFRPAVVLVKMSSSTGNWTILDDKREGYNVDNDPLYPNLSNAEGTTDLIDITSNGFKVRTTDTTFNTNAGTYIYAAWASSPFTYSRAR